MADLKYPERLLQPFRNLTHFSQELYAMFRNAGSDTEGSAFEPEVKPVSRRPAPTQSRQPLPEIDPYKADGGDQASPRLQEAAAPAPKTIEPKVARPRALAEERRQEAGAPPVIPPAARKAKPSERPRPAPPTPPPIPPPKFSEPPESTRSETPSPSESPRAVKRDQEDAKARREWDDIWGKANPDSEEPRIGGGGGTTVFVGKVMSYAHPIAKCVIYDQGPSLDPSDTTQVDVTIQDVNPNETFRGVTWLYSIFQFSDNDGNDIYFAQPPMWIA